MKKPSLALPGEFLSSKTLAISTGPSTHLDHLAPLCCLLDVPLIVTEPDHQLLAEKFYPMVDTRYIPLLDLSYGYLAEHCDTLIASGKFWAMELKPALKLLFNKELRLIFTPHGYSDKEDLLQDKASQDITLTYSKNTGEGIPTGNIRLWFYLEYKTHFDELAAPYFSSDKESLLYAPSWTSKATSTSFFEKTDEVVKTLSEKYNLIIKPHPLLEENDPAHYHHLIGKHQEKATFVEGFPPVYPLLEKCIAYLGDHSSVGYDFLYYDRPMYFLSEGGKLSASGERFMGKIEKQKHLSEIRQRLYKEVFEK